MIVLKGFCYKNTNFQVHGNRSTRKLQNVSLGTFIILIDPADFEFESWKLHNQPDGKVQLISKGLVGILNSSKKRTKEFDIVQKNEFVRLFFGRIVGLKEPLRFCLTFNLDMLLT